MSALGSRGDFFVATIFEQMSEMNKERTTKRGRPAFGATPTLRRKVSELVACGMSQQDVARAVGCSAPTLVAHFAAELATGRAVRRAEVIGLLFRQARGGNVTAQKALEHLTSITSPGAPPPQTARKSGKKEQAEIDAATAGEGTEWAKLIH